MWTGTAISNAKWTGCRLRVCNYNIFILSKIQDILKEAGVDLNSKQINHVHFEGADKDESGIYIDLKFI